jgi:homoserine kinase
MPHVTVRVPATTANLGPGYDAFGLALGLYDTFEATPSPSWEVRITGEGAESLSRDTDNQVVLAMKAVFAAAEQEEQRALVSCDNRVPTGRGLGSSAAAIVGGLLLADAMLPEPLGDEKLFELACELEGHPDNVGAAMYGGFVIGWADGDAGWRAARIDPADGIACVAAIPQWELLTSHARDMLPERVRHEDAAFNAGRAGLLAVGMATGRRELLAAGVADRLHQPHRAAAIADFEEVVGAMTGAGAVGAVLSGAGPAILGLVCDENDAAALQRAAAIAERVTRALGERARRTLIPLAVDRRGAVRT